MSVLYKIKEAYDSFTETEKTIANYIVDQQAVVLELSAKELGEQTGTSAAAWVRFSKKMGYKGLPSLKVALAKEQAINLAEMDIDVFLNPQDSLDLLVKKTENMVTKNVDKTFRLLNLTDLEKTVHCLNQARNLFLLGVGGSSVVCIDLYHKMTRINKSVSYDRDLHIMMSKMAHLQKNDVVLVISYSGETHEINNIARVAKEKGALVVAVTSYNLKSELVGISDINLFIPIEEKDIRLGSITSRNSMLIMTDLLYYCVAKIDFNATKDMLIKTRKFIKETY